MDQSQIQCPFEIKLASSDKAGEFEGYAAVFNSTGTDSHGDRILPGAFADSIAQRKAAGRGLPMYMQHGAVLGGDPRPVGVWDHVAEDTKGLAVKGHIVGLNTETGRYNHALVKDGAMRGLSIGYRVPEGGATKGMKPGEPRRTISKVDLREISLVDDPSDADARVHSVKLSSQRELETLLRDGGLSRAAAVKAASAAWPALAEDNLDEDLSPQIKSLAALVRAATLELKKG